jgi:ribonuclease G
LNGHRLLLRVNPDIARALKEEESAVLRDLRQAIGKEVQIRLRDLGGIIVLDLIDMEEKKNRQRVFQEVEKELRKDRSPSKALQVSDFGLVIVTRKRVKQSLERQLTEPCPYCSGSGSIKSSSTICHEILTELQKIGEDLDGRGVVLRVNPDIARALKEEESGIFRDLQETLGKPITLRADAHLHHEQFDVMAI